MIASEGFQPSWPEAVFGIVAVICIAIVVCFWIWNEYHCDD